MIENLIEGFYTVLTVSNLLAILGGVLVGSILGVLPGLSATMGIAIVLPITFGMSPITAISMLLAAYKAGTFAGSIPAILLNTPGTSAASATMLDGHPMAQKGEAKKAMDIALYSSVVGDFFGTLALIFISFLLIKIALLFGPIENTALILFSLTIVAGLAGDSLIKGGISALIGSLLSFIGLGPMSGIPRLTFGIPYLMEGISLIVIMIALFALSEILVQSRSRSQDTIVNKTANIKMERMKLKDFKENFKVMIRGSIIGTIIGAMPGLGATVAVFVSYGLAKATSKDPSKFGTGIPQGVAAVESANNATCSSVLIPLLTLGIPGNLTAAILLGGLMIHGLVPGPRLFTEHSSTIYAIFAGLIISGIILFLLGTQAVKLFAFITKVPRSIIFPVSMILCTIGVYAVNQSFLDLYLMGILGTVGYFLRKYKFPLPPLLITFILTPIGERSFRQTYSLVNGNMLVFFTKPISLTLIILTIISVLIIIKQRSKGLT